jgi:hypothetical protein
MAKTNEFSVKDRVTSSTYGEGTISAMDEKYTTVAFDHNGTRRFLTTLVKLERSDSAPPVKPERAKKGK